MADDKHNHPQYFQQGNDNPTFSRPGAKSMYPDKSNPNPQPQPMNYPQQYPPNPQYPPPQYPPGPGVTPYPQQQYYGQPSQQQQSTNVVVVGGQPAPGIQQQWPYISFTSAIVFSCFVIWCCGGLIFGVIAFILAREWNSQILIFLIWTHLDALHKSPHGPIERQVSP